MIATNTTFDQLHNRFYSDSGADEDNLTALLAEDADDTDTDALGGLDVAVHWRVLMSETSVSGSLARTGGVIQLQYRVDTGAGFSAWTTVDGSSNNVRTASGQPTDGATLSRKLTANGANSFVSAGYDDVDGATASITPGANEDIEAQFCITFRSADLNDGDIVELRIIQAGSALDAYSTTPTIEVTKVAATVRKTLPTTGAG